MTDTVKELLAGDTAARVRTAALAEVDGGTIDRLETAGDGPASYVAHMLDADAERLSVYLDEQFDVVSIESP